MARRSDTVERAIAAPRSIYASPEQVLKDRRFGAAEKRAVLLAWERSVREQGTGEPLGEEAEPGVLDRVLAALARLDEDEAGSPAPPGRSESAETDGKR